MSLFNDHARCYEIISGDGADDADEVDADDAAKRKLIYDNLSNFKMTFGKYKDTRFKDVFSNDSKYSSWLCDSNSINPTVKLFRTYICKTIKKKKPCKSISLPTTVSHRTSFREYKKRMRQCRFCDEMVDVKETFSRDECSVCGFEL
tara:strand:- start:6331 stop:6771 length:441 start_codon:yes stop_codon:yes gene_type:complete